MLLLCRGVFCFVPLCFIEFYWKRSLSFCLDGWQNWVGKQSLDIWNFVPLCLMCTLLREHNLCTFEFVESSELQFFISNVELFSRSLFDWSRAWGFFNTNSIPEL